MGMVDDLRNAIKDAMAGIKALSPVPRVHEVAAGCTMPISSTYPPVSMKVVNAGESGIHLYELSERAMAESEFRRVLKDAMDTI